MPANAKPAATVRRIFCRQTIAEKAPRIAGDSGRDRKLAIFMDYLDPLIAVRERSREPKPPRLGIFPS
jgi:hypothetical protein